MESKHRAVKDPLHSDLVPIFLVMVALTLLIVAAGVCR